MPSFVLVRKYRCDTDQQVNLIDTRAAFRFLGAGTLHLLQQVTDHGAQRRRVDKTACGAARSGWRASSELLGRRLLEMGRPEYRTCRRSFFGLSAALAARQAIIANDQIRSLSVFRKAGKRRIVRGRRHGLVSPASEQSTHPLKDQRIVIKDDDKSCHRRIVRHLYGGIPRPFF